MNFYRNYQSADRTGEESATVSSVIVEEITPSPAIQSETDMSTQNNTDTSENEKKDSGTPNNASDVSGDTAWNDPQKKAEQISANYPVQRNRLRQYRKRQK